MRRAGSPTPEYFSSSEKCGWSSPANPPSISMIILISPWTSGDGVSLNLPGIPLVSSEWKLARGLMLSLPVLNLIKDVKASESFSESRNFSRRNFMSGNNTTGEDLWERAYVHHLPFITFTYHNWCIFNFKSFCQFCWIKMVRCPVWWAQILEV